jgi:tetratricopeptide (TPR) repeat protein
MKTRIIFTLLFIFSITVFAQKREIKDAEKAVENKEYDEAKSLLSQVEGTYKNENERWQSTYLMTKGKAYLGDGLTTSIEDFKTAAQAFQDAIDLGEDVEDAKAAMDQLRADLVNSAVEDQRKSKNLVAANKLYESYKLGKQDTLYLYYAANSALNAQEYDMALDYYKTLIDLDYNGSQTLYQAKNLDTGVMETFGSKILRDASVKSGTHVEPNDEVTPSKKGEIAKFVSLIYIEQDKPDQAIEAMKMAKAENPNDIPLMQAEADLYYKLGDMEKYSKIMSEISELSPDDPIVFYNLGVSTEKLEDFDKAKEFYLKAIELDPEMANAYNNVASIILKEDRKITEEMNKLGMSTADTKKYDELKEKKIGILKEAVPYLKKTIELDSTNVNAMKYLKSIYYQTGENEKAKSMDELIQNAEGN